MSLCQIPLHTDKQVVIFHTAMHGTVLVFNILPIKCYLGGQDAMQYATVIHICVALCSLEDGEKKDVDKTRDEGPADTRVEEERRPSKNRPRQKEEPPEAVMASFFAGLEIYQTKMLVCIRVQHLLIKLNTHLIIPLKAFVTFLSLLPPLKPRLDWTLMIVSRYAFFFRTTLRGTSTTSVS